MIQSENGYFEGANTSTESSRRVYGEIKNKKKAVKWNIIVSIGRRTLLDDGSTRRSTQVTPQMFPNYHFSFL